MSHSCKFYIVFAMWFKLVLTTDNSDGPSTLPGKVACLLYLGSEVLLLSFQALEGRVGQRGEISNIYDDNQVTKILANRQFVEIDNATYFVDIRSLNIIAMTLKLCVNRTLFSKKTNLI